MARDGFCGTIILSGMGPRIPYPKMSMRDTEQQTNIYTETLAEMAFLVGRSDCTQAGIWHGLSDRHLSFHNSMSLLVRYL